MTAETEAASTAAVKTAGAAPGASWHHRHLLDLDVVSWPEIELIMRTTDEMKGIDRKSVV